MKRTLAVAVAVIIVGVAAVAVGIAYTSRESAVSELRSAEVKAVLSAPPLVPPPVDRPGPAKVIVELETTELKGRLASNVDYTFWTFGGTVPGPMVRVRVGDTVQIRLKTPRAVTTGTRSTCTP